jgi:Na+/serine symporter
LRTGACIVFPQFACTVITIGFLEHFDKDMLLRLTVATPLVAALSVAPWLFTWLIRRNITEASD